MKKLLSALLVVILAFSTVTVAFAVETGEDVSSKLSEELVNYLDTATDTEEIFVSVWFSNPEGDLYVSEKDKKIIDDILGEGQYRIYYYCIGIPNADLYLTKEQIYKIAQSEEISLIKYINDKNITPGDCTDSSKKTPYQVFYEFMLGYGYKPSTSKDSSSGIVNLGKVGSGTLFYGSTGGCTLDDPYYYMTIGGYKFEYLPIQPGEIGLYVVNGNSVKPLSQSYEEDKTDMAKVVSLLNAYDNKNLINFNIYKGSKQVYGHASTRIPYSKYTLKSGVTSTIKVYNGQVKQWKSSNSKVAKINDKGAVTCLNKGTSTITAVLTNGRKLTCKVNVTNAPRLSKTSVVVKKGKSTKITVLGKVPSIKTKYNNTKIAKIYTCNCSCKCSNTLTVVGFKKGKTTIKVNINGVKTVKLNVTVK